MPLLEINQIRHISASVRLDEYIVCGCPYESGILIDLCSDGFIQPNRSTDMANLVDFK